MNKNFKIGDTVRVVNKGEQYSNYEEMATLMKLQNWGCNYEVRKGDIGEVVAIRNHTTWGGTICVGIRVKSTGRDHIIGADGLELFAPELWAIEVTDENHSIVNAWWRTKASEYYVNDYRPNGVCIGETILSKHYNDESYFYTMGINQLISNHPGYTPITLEQFIEITKQENNMKTLDPNKEITIGRDLLNQYYDAATKEQRGYINNNFKVDGTTTVQGIIGLHDIACSTWKPKIKRNHPECFPVTKTAIELAVEKAGKPNYGMCKVTIKDDLILVELPNANTEWSFAAFEWVMKFCKENPQSYPVHKDTNNNSDYLYIQWN